MQEEQSNESAGSGTPSPQEVHERLAHYLTETESLLASLQDGLIKGEEQVRAVKTFDEKIKQIGGGIDPIDTAAVEKEIESIRTHVVSLGELRERIKTDIARVDRISEKIAEILDQYQSRG